MPDLAVSLPQTSTQLNDLTVEEVAGIVLEWIGKRTDSFGLHNLLIEITAVLKDPDKTFPSRIYAEGFQWLANHDLVAPDSQPGWYSVTRLGRNIGTAAKLKDYLANLRTMAIAEYEQARQDAATLKADAKKEIDAAIADAKREASSILGLARKTAQGVSLSDVQTQFRTAARECLSGISIWAGLSSFFIIAFILLLIGFVTWWEPVFQIAAPIAAASGASGASGSATVQASSQTGLTAAAIYHTVIRVSILTAIAAVAMFCLKVLRAQMHLREQNLHRMRVANSMDAFLGAASSPEQRDFILAKMVEAIAAFGASGLLVDNDESLSPAKLILENVPKVLGGSK